MLMARRMGNRLPTSVMAFYQNGFFLLGSGFAAGMLQLLGIEHATHPSVVFLVRPWVLPTLTDGALITVCGVVAASGTMFLTAAYRVAKSSTVTPFEYTGILWAPLWGFLFFAEVPKFTTFVGATVILVSGLLAMRLAKK
jgi:drug/metabolite transporter (DMT)-like permease